MSVSVLNSYLGCPHFRVLSTVFGAEKRGRAMNKTHMGACVSQKFVCPNNIMNANRNRESASLRSTTFTFNFGSSFSSIIRNVIVLKLH